MKKRILSFCAALLLCVSLAISASAAAYPAGIAEQLPRMDDGASLLMEVPVEALDARAREIALQYHMDIVIVTRRGIGGKTPEAFADDYFDYGGYGWREEESDDVTTGSGILLLVEMQESDVLISTKGEGESVFRDGVWEQIIDAIKPQLGSGEYRAAFSRFLDEAERCLADYAAGAGVYADPDEPYNQGHYDENGSYVYGDGSDGGDYVYDGDYDYSGPLGLYIPFSGGVFVIALILALIIAWAVVASMKKKHNTIRIAAAAGNYQHGFNLTERQDIFLYSNTTRMRLPEPTTTSSSGGGSSFSGGGSHTSSSGSSHGGGGSKF